MALLETGAKHPRFESAEEKERRFQLQADTLQERIGYRFKNRTLLIQALTKPSFAQLHALPLPDNKALERQGDRLLRTYVREWITHLPEHPFPSSQFGLYLDFFNSNTFLSFVGMHLGVDQAVRVSTNRVRATTPSQVISRTNGRPGELQARLTSDTVEALLGALQVDGGEIVSREFTQRFILNGVARAFVHFLAKIDSPEIEHIRSGFTEITNGKGNLKIHELRGRFVTTILYDGVPFEPVVDRATPADSARDAALSFLNQSPWVLWGFDGPASLIMPRASNEPYGAQPTPLVVPEPIYENGGRVLDLPGLQPYSTLNKGPYIDQLRLAFVKDNITLTVRSLHAKTKRPKFAFYLDGALYVTVGNAKGLNDAARMVLEQFRRDRKNRK